MRTIQAAYPAQRRRQYLRRLAKCAALKAMACRPAYGLFVRGCRAIGCDYDRWVNQTARGFPGGDLMAQIRRRPAAPLLAVLARRLRYYDPRRRRRRAERGQALAALMPADALCLGPTDGPHAYWVFPVLAADPQRLVERLARAGFDATHGHNMCVAPPPAGCGDPPAVAAEAEDILKRIVFLPFYPELPNRELRRMAAVVNGCIADQRPDG